MRQRISTWLAIGIGLLLVILAVAFAWMQSA
jgi:hypothetical protein